MASPVTRVQRNPYADFLRAFSLLIVILLHLNGMLNRNLRSLSRLCLPTFLPGGY